MQILLIDFSVNVNTLLCYFIVILEEDDHVIYHIRLAVLADMILFVDTFLNMPLKEKRRKYRCGDFFVQLNDIETWEKYAQKLKKKQTRSSGEEFSGGLVQIECSALRCNSSFSGMFLRAEKFDKNAKNMVTNVYRQADWYSKAVSHIYIYIKIFY